MRVDVLSTPGIKAWATMPTTDSSRLDKINGAEAPMPTVVREPAQSRTSTGNGCRAKDRRKNGTEKV